MLPIESRGSAARSIARLNLTHVLDLSTKRKLNPHLEIFKSLVPSLDNEKASTFFLTTPGGPVVFARTAKASEPRL